MLTRFLLIFSLASYMWAMQSAIVPCEIGGKVVVTGGVNSTTKVMQSFVSCTINVYLAGTTTWASLFSNNTGTALANPFTANTSGFGQFYAADGRYDIQISNGGPPSLPVPYTFHDVAVGSVYYPIGSDVPLEPGGVARSSISKLSDILSVKDFGAKGDGTTNDYQSIVKATTAAVRVHSSLYFPFGTYLFATGLQFGYSQLNILCDPGTVLYFTGTGTAVAFNGPSNGEIEGTGMRNCRVKGTASTTDGILFQRAHRSILDHVSVVDVTGACLKTKWAVLGSANLFRCSVFDVFTVQPQNGMYLDSDNPGEQTTAWTFTSPIIEGVAGDGIVLADSGGVVMTAGTSEQNGGKGLVIGANSTNNQIIGIDLEANGGIDAEISGSENKLSPAIAVHNVEFKSGARGNVVGQGACRVNGVVFDSGSYNNTLTECVVNINGGGLPIDNDGRNSTPSIVDAESSQYLNGYITQPFSIVNPRRAISGIATAPPQDNLNVILRLTNSPTDVSNTVLVVGQPWRALISGFWMSNGDGSGMVQPASLIEATSDDPTIQVGGNAITFSVNGSSGHLQATTNFYTVGFSGTIKVMAHGYGSATGGHESVNLKGTIRAKNVIGAGFNFGNSLLGAGFDFGADTYYSTAGKTGAIGTSFQYQTGSQFWINACAIDRFCLGSNGAKGTSATSPIQLTNGATPRLLLGYGATDDGANPIQLQGATKISAGTVGRALCKKSDSTIGSCTSVVASNGACTCN